MAAEPEQLGRREIGRGQSAETDTEDRSRKLRRGHARKVAGELVLGGRGIERDRSAETVAGYRGRRARRVHTRKAGLGMVLGGREGTGH